ncbi:MAG: hypothetical protein H8D47_03520 [Planctomycetes bacterium]|nr:hypothetical protein [Planctomycetota bacterium]MBL7107193.1 hypothetical protein [Phycisphaerae bacterium]
MKNLKNIFIVIYFCLVSVSIAGSYAPPAGQAGSTAIYKDSNSFDAWATNIMIERGFQDISNQTSEYAYFGSDANALYIAEGTSDDVVSLGDGGVATLTFDDSIYITNGEGYDFAVFENSFNDTFLELALVEVSSDGVNFFGFDAISLTPTNKQVNGFGNLDTINIHNLAGKYRRGYGTPFDLAELKDTSELLDVNSITHVRIIDVVGYVEPADFYGDGVVNFIDFSIFVAAYPSKVGDENWNVDCDISNPPNGIIDFDDFQIFMDKWLNENDYSSCDINGHQINDPWPTEFYTGGFDLDAVGVINAKLR